MARLYQGITLLPYKDKPSELRNMKLINDFLRDVSRGLGNNEPALPDAPTPILSNLPLITVGNTSLLSKERAVSTTSPIIGTDGGANSSFTWSFDTDTTDLTGYLHSAESDSYTAGTLTFDSGTLIQIASGSEIDVASGATLDVNGTADFSQNTAMTLSSADPSIAYGASGTDELITFAGTGSATNVLNLAAPSGGGTLLALTTAVAANFISSGNPLTVRAITDNLTLDTITSGDIVLNPAGNTTSTSPVVLSNTAPLTLSGSDPTISFGAAETADVLVLSGSGVTLNTIQLPGPGGSATLSLTSTATSTNITSTDTMSISSVGSLLLSSVTSGDVTITSASGTINVSDNVLMLDNIKSLHGDASDVETYFDGTDFHVDASGVTAAAKVQLHTLEMVLNDGAAGDPTITFDGATNDGTIAWDDSANEFIASGVGLRLPGTTVAITDTSVITFGSGSLLAGLVLQGTGSLATTFTIKEVGGAKLNLNHGTSSSDFAADNALSFVASNGTMKFGTVSTFDIIFNDSGAADIDIRMESDNDANMFFLDGSADKIGIGTASPIATLDVNGSFAANLKTITNSDTPYSALATDYTIICDCSSGVITVALPAAASNTDRIINVKKIDSTANAVTIDGNSAETIDGATTQVFNTQYINIPVQCDGSNWHIL